MAYKFFATKSDKLEVLDFIFRETDLQVFDLSSAYGQAICEYKTAYEILSKSDFDNGGKFANTFQLWSPRHKREPIFRRVDIDPKHCNGHTFRYSTEGWGLIQLYFGALTDNGLNPSHIGHFNERGALKWEGFNIGNGFVGLWDWAEIQTTSRKLKHQIHDKMSVRKIGSIGILAGADKLEKQGIELR